MAVRAPCNPFLLAPPSHSRLVLKSPKLAAFAKNGTSSPSSSLRKSAREISSDKNSGNLNPFQFNWGGLSDGSSLIPVVNSPPALTGLARRKDAGTVFVAGATGQVGVRIALMLLREGFRVRAGVPDLVAAQDLARFASGYKIISKEESKRLNAVESMFDDAELIAKAIGNASKVVVTIGSTENGPTKGVTTSDALQVVEAAQLAGVGHVAIIYDDSASSASSALDSISSFFSNLFSRSQSLSIADFLDKVIQTDVRYTFIKTALADDFSPESTYNVVVTAEGSAGSNDYKVPRSQMASLVASLFSNTEVAENKVVEIYTDPSAPLKSPNELFSVIPEDGRRKAYAEALAKVKAEEEATKAAEQVREAEAAAKNRLEDEARAASLAEEAKQKAKEVGTSVDNFLSKAKDFGNGFSWNKIGSQFASSVKTPDFEIPNVQMAIVRGQGKAQNLPSQKAMVKQPASKTRPKPRPRPEPRTSAVAIEAQGKPKDQAKEVRNILGGIFKQETIYVDDD